MVALDAGVGQAQAGALHAKHCKGSSTQATAHLVDVQVLLGFAFLLSGQGSDETESLWGVEPLDGSLLPFRDDWLLLWLLLLRCGVFSHPH